MKKRFTELTFKVTETCNNGKERTFRKKVLAPPFYKEEGRTFNNSLGRCVPLAIDSLKAQHYYNIEFIESASAIITFTDDIEENF